MKKYVVEVYLESRYEVEAENEERAAEKAIEYFQECEPHVMVSPYEEDAEDYDEEEEEEEEPYIWNV